MEHRATYSPEDNKLRLYPDWDDPDFDKEVVKAAGFRWASKQECYVCPRWTPKAEDACLELVDEIEDEDYSPEERAADRAERFGGYRDKRRSEAHGHADTFEAGPSAFGHQNQQRAERQAARHDKHRTRGLTQWSKAEYWQYRTAGVISNALYRSSAKVRRGRLRRLESEHRKHMKGIDESKSRYDAWTEIADMDGADVLLPLNDAGFAIEDELNEAQRKAYQLANRPTGWNAFHPTSEKANEKAKEVHGKYWWGFSAYDFLTDDDYCGAPFERMTPKQFADFYLSKTAEPLCEGGSDARWKNHYELRIGYERAMLEAEGGIASDDKIEPGYVTKTGKYQVIKVNKSQSDSRIVSVNVVDTTTWKEECQINIERMASGEFVPPTDEQKAAFNAWKKEQKAKTKARNARKPKLINPTPEDAAKLQDLLNARYKDDEKSTPINSTQKAYSSQTGNYGKCETITIGEKMRPMNNSWYGGATNANTQWKGVIKIRIYKNGYNASRVVIITDKPQKPIPWELFEKAKEGMPTEETHGRAFAELFNRHAEWGYEFNNLPDDEREAAKKLRQDAGYLGWADISCANQFNPTKEGHRILEKWREIIESEKTPVEAGKLF